MKRQTETSQLAPAITMTTATIVRGRQDDALQAVFALVADSARPAWQRSAVLRGAETALLETGGPAAQDVEVLVRLGVAGGPSDRAAAWAARPRFRERRPLLETRRR